MDDHAPPSEEVLTQAANWLARLHADDRRPEEEGLFQAWLSGNPEHAIAFEAVAQSWAVLGSVPHPARLESRKFLSRRKVLMAGIGMVVAAGGTLSFLRTGSAQVYETKVGEQKHVSLQDGSRIFLNAQTRVTVLLNENQRIADLQYGRANFDVAADPKRLFVVKVAQRQIISQQCNFDVRREGDRIEVVLIRGTANIISPTISNSKGGDQKEMLHAGDRLVADPNHIRQDRPNLAPLLAWQVRQAIFDNQPLIEAVREMNLYSSEKLEVADATVARLRVSGVYHVGDNPGFARSISKLLPLSVYVQGGHLVLAAAQDNR